MAALKDAGIDDDTIVVWTTDNGAWIDTWPDAGETLPWRKEQYLRGWLPGSRHRPLAGPCSRRGSESRYVLMHGLVSDAGGASWSACPPRHWVDNSGTPIVFDGIDQSDLILARALESVTQSYSSAPVEALRCAADAGS